MPPSKEELELANKARLFQKARAEKKARDDRRDGRESRRRERRARRASASRDSSASPRASVSGMLKTLFSGAPKFGRANDGEREELLRNDRGYATSDTGTTHADDARTTLSSSKKSRGVDGGESSTTSSDDDDAGDARANRMFVESTSARGYTRLTRDALRTLDEVERGVGVSARVSGANLHSTSSVVAAMVPKTWRTWAATASVSLTCFTVGLAIGFPFAARKTMSCGGETAACGTDGANEDEIATLQEALFLGAIVGAARAGWGCDRFGRRRTVVAATIPAILGWALAACAPAFSTTAMVGRVLAGISVGIVTTAAPLLLIEASSKSMRGAHAILPNLAIVKGVLFMYLSPLSPVTMHWRHLAGVCAMFNVIALIIAIICVVESPRWLLAREMRIEAVEAFTTLRGAYKEREAMEDVANIVARENAKTSPSGAFAAFRWYDLLLDSHLSRSMMIACALVGIQQLGGLSLAVHDDGEIPSNGAVPSSTETRIAYVVTLLFGIMVCSRMVDYMGRKPCMLASLAGMCLCNLAMASAAAGYALGSARDALDVAIISFAFFYGLGMAAIPMLIAAELFPQHARGTAISLTLTLYWSYVFVETFAYELALDAFGASAIHVFFAVVCVVGAIYVKYAVLETANRALEDTVALVIPHNDVRVATAPSRPSRRKEAKRVVIL